MKKGFTLAEVLITLSIIGIVAAMTLPVLIQKNKEKELVTKLKKFNSVMSQAFLLAINENGKIENWGLSRAGMSAEPTDEEKLSGDAVVNKFWDILSPYLKIITRCKLGSNDCKSYERTSLNGTKFSYFTPLVILADGTYIVGTTVADASCKSNAGGGVSLQNVCGEMFVDLNGPKPPNTTGIDVFLFYYTNYGLYPMGTQGETRFSFDNSCNINITNKLNGYGCTAWVIYNENMDYIRCGNLSWDGKSKCK